MNIQRETLDWLVLYRPRLPPPLLTCLGLMGKTEELMSQCRANKAIIGQRSSDNQTKTCFKLLSERITWSCNITIRSRAMI